MASKRLQAGARGALGAHRSAGEEFEQRAREDRARRQPADPEVLGDVVGLVVQRTGLVDVALHRQEDRLVPEQSGGHAEVTGDPLAQRAAALDGLCRGHRPEERKESERLGGADGVKPVACTLGMDDCALEVGRRVRVALQGDVGHESQPGGQPFVVIEQLEFGDQRLDRRLERGDVDVGLGVPHGDAQLRDPRPRGGAAVARGPRESHGLAGGSGRAQQLAIVLQRAGQLDQDRGTLDVGSQGQRTLQESRGDRRLVAGGRATPRALKARRRAGRQAGRGCLARAELAAEEDSALEVVAEQFVDGGQRWPGAPRAGRRSARAARRACPSISRRTPRRG